MDKIQKMVVTLTATPDRVNVVTSVLLSSLVEMAIGGEEWDLMEEQEMLLWRIIEELKAAQV